jgi:hypothetical protein
MLAAAVVVLKLAAAVVASQLDQVVEKSMWAGAVEVSRREQ